MTAHSIASKFRRALRNGTGATFTQEQLQELARYGVLKALAQIEAEELCPANDHPSLSATIGFASGETESPPTSGKSPPAARAPLSIEALSAGM